jgi:hypothetical protein
MTDIVDRLRERSGEYDEYAWHSDIELEAADEIEKLRGQLIEAEASARRCWNAYHRERKGES